MCAACGGTHYLKYRYSVLLSEEAEQYTGGNCRTDNTCNVGTHGVHEKVVAWVGLETLVVADAGSHWHGAHASITNQWIQLLVLGQDEVEDLHKEDTRCGGDDERHEAKSENLDGVGSEELRSLSRCANGHTQDDGNHVGHGVACGLGKAGGHATLAKQVTEEQHSEQWQTTGHEHASEN